MYVELSDGRLLPPKLAKPSALGSMLRLTTSWLSAGTQIGGSNDARCRFCPVTLTVSRVPINSRSTPGSTGSPPSVSIQS